MISFLILISISLVGCQKNSESLEKITIEPMESHLETLVIEDTETIEMIEEAVSNSKEQPGIVNMEDPEFKIEIGEETYFLWIDEKSGTFMNTKDTHTIYSLPVSSIKQINNIISYNASKIREIAWNFLEERGWSDSTKEEWKSAAVTKIIVNKDYELLDKNYKGNGVFSVLFEDKENIVVIHRLYWLMLKQTMLLAICQGNKNLIKYTGA